MDLELAEVDEEHVPVGQSNDQIDEFALKSADTVNALHFEIVVVVKMIEVVFLGEELAAVEQAFQCQLSDEFEIERFEVVPVNVNFLPRVYILPLFQVEFQKK